MEEASESSVLRTVGLFLFGLLAVTGCAILALVLSVPSASAAETSDEQATQSSLSVQALLHAPLEQASTELSVTLDAVTAPIRHTGEAIAPKTTHALEHTIAAVGSGALDAVATIVDAVPSVELPPAIETVVLDQLPAASEASATASDAAPRSALTAPLTATVILTEVELAESATTSPEPPSHPGDGGPFAPPATVPGAAPNGAQADHGVPPAIVGERWDVTLASGLTTSGSDRAPGSPSFGFDSTPD